jgi:excisionase family DNA binding protein
MAKIIGRDPILVSEDERSSLEQVASLLERSSPEETRLIGANGQQVSLPEPLLHVLHQMVSYLAHDRIVTVIPLSKDLTTQQAARLLKVSRPYLIKLLEDGVIPYTMVGTHRRIRYRDVMEHKQRMDAEQQQALEDLTRLSEALGLYDE